VVSARRTPSLPNVVGMEEAGVAGVDISSFSDVAALAKTPRPIVDLLTRHFNAILREPETKAMFFARGYGVAGGSPEDFQRALAADVATWSRVIRAADIRFE